MVDGRVSKIGRGARLTQSPHKSNKPTVENDRPRDSGRQTTATLELRVRQAVRILAGLLESP